MKHLTLFFLTLVAAGAYGQTANLKASEAKPKKIQIGISFSPDICFRTLKNMDGSSTTDRAIELYNQSETRKLGCTVGYNICFNIKKHFSLQTGFQYSNKGYQTRLQDLRFAQPRPDNPLKSKFIYNYHFIDIPVKVNFTIGKNKIRFITGVGITTNIFIKEIQTSVLVFSDDTKRERRPTTYDYNKINISPTFSFGIDYQINSKINLRVEPTVRYGIIKMFNSSPIGYYLYSAGLNIGCYYRL